MYKGEKILVFKKLLSKIIVILLAVFLLCFGCNNNIYEDKNYYTKSDDVIDVNSFVKVPDKRINLSEIRQINPDVVAWITIPGTTIDSPVMKWLVNDKNGKSLYDRKDQYGNYAFEGSLYVGEYVNFFPFSELSNNLVIYGHNLDDNPYGKRFAQLINFRNFEFAENTPYIFVTTEDAQLVYQVYAVFFTDLEFKYHVVGCDEFGQQDIINGAKERSEYIYDVDVSGKDKIITLSTCTYRYGKYQSVGQENTRFVVQGKLIKDTEHLFNKASIKINQSPKEPNIPNNF